MELTIKENVNVNSIVLKHRIALEAVALLSDKEIVLDTEARVYTMISIVDNFTNENILQLIEEDEGDFIDILQYDIEPIYYEILEQYDIDVDGITKDVIKYLDSHTNMMGTFAGLVNEVYYKVKSGEWDDLQFFFNKVATTVKDNLPDAPIKEQNKEDELDLTTYEGASAKMAELINQFQRTAEEINLDKLVEEQKDSEE